MKIPNKFITVIFLTAVLFGAYQFFKNKANIEKNIPEPDQTSSISSDQTSPEEKDLKKDSSAVKIKDYEKEQEEELKEDVEEEEGEWEEEEEERLLSETEDEGEEKKSLKDRLLERNPFTLRRGRNPYKKIQGDDKEFFDTNESTFLDLRLTSILISEEIKVATVDQTPFVLTINDVIGNEKVTDIKSDHIILSHNGLQRTVFLTFSNDSQIKMEGVK